MGVTYPLDKVAVGEAALAICVGTAKIINSVKNKIVRTNAALVKLFFSSIFNQSLNDNALLSCLRKGLLSNGRERALMFFTFPSNKKPCDFIQTTTVFMEKKKRK